MPKSYVRRSPVIYATQRAALAGRVRGGETVEAVARELCIPRSTARLWAAQDGFRLKDFAADSQGAPREEPGNWAKPGRKGRRPAPAAEPEDGLLPPADYPELKGLPARARLRKLSELASAAQMRAISAIEEGCIGFALSSMREAQKLSRAWRAMQDWLEKYPEAPDEDEADPDQDWKIMVAEDMQAMAEGREPVYLPPRPEEAAREARDKDIWDAIREAETADLARLGLTADDMTDREFALREMELAGEFRRLQREREKWLALPGRGAPPVRVMLPARRAGAGSYVSECMKPVFPGGMRDALTPEQG